MITDSDICSPIHLVIHFKHLLENVQLKGGSRHSWGACAHDRPPLERFV